MTKVLMPDIHILHSKFAKLAEFKLPIRLSNVTPIIETQGYLYEFLDFEDRKVTLTGQDLEQILNATIEAEQNFLKAPLVGEE